MNPKFIILLATGVAVVGSIIVEYISSRRQRQRSESEVRENSRANQVRNNCELCNTPTFSDERQNCGHFYHSECVDTLRLSSLSPQCVVHTCRSYLH